MALVEQPRFRHSEDGRGIFFWQQAPRTSSTSAPRRYRIGNLAELLPRSTVVLRSRPDFELFRRARVVSCLRPTLDPDTLALLERCRAAGALLVADFDDLMFAGSVEHWPDVIAGHVSVPEAERKQARYRDALGVFDAFTASTEVLARELREASGGARVAVVPNGVSQHWLWQGRALYRRPKDQALKVIRYLPGSRHDHDLGVAAAPIGRFLSRRAQVRFEVLGPSDALPEALPTSSTRRLPRVPFDHLPEFLCTSWLTIAPLVDNRFNRAKSAIKFLESAAFGTPCIATPIPDMRAHEQGGLALPSTEAEWEQALEILDDPSSHREASERGEAWVSEHTAARSVSALLTALEEWRR
jgi:glycosyltransferase involved in cell wall biosynthesis